MFRVPRGVSTPRGKHVPPQDRFRSRYSEGRGINSSHRPVLLANRRNQNPSAGSAREPPEPESIGRFCLRTAGTRIHRPVLLASRRNQNPSAGSAREPPELHHQSPHFSQETMIELLRLRACRLPHQCPHLAPETMIELLRLRACRLLCAHGRWQATNEYRHRLRRAVPRVRDSEEALPRVRVVPLVRDIDIAGPPQGCTWPQRHHRGPESLILDLTPCEDYSSGSRRRACVVAKTGVSHTPGVGFVVGGPSPYEFPGYSELDISQQVLIHRCITTQLRRVRRKTHDTDGRYITGARVPATRVLPHEASPLSGEPASPCDGAAPGTRLWPISDDRYISICRRR